MPPRATASGRSFGTKNLGTCGEISVIVFVVLFGLLLLSCRDES